MRRRALLSLVISFALAPTAWPQVIETRPLSDLKALPISIGDGEVDKLLRAWKREGTAAGNAGDWYDNRDGEHSPLDLRPWPQLQKVHYTEEMVKTRVHWGLQSKALPAVVFGNSSTSAPATQGGSNPRQLYSSPFGLNILDQQYAKNNLYIYPEHRDHDPGRNGRGPGAEEGYGDLYPTNTPYVIISQGSSGSDQPFMRALPYVFAAFRPDVKAKLIENGTLMSTVQMIFRASNKHLKDGDYLTAKAHPTVFEGAWVDPVKMVQMAHDITIDALPPAVKLKVVDEDRPRPTRDYFDPANSEAIGDTSAVIARIFRGKDLWRKMTVSAEGSRDLNGKPLKYRWVLLRGDPQGFKITPKNESGSIVELEVAHPKRRPIAPGSPLESSRVDVGVFVHNGSHWSAPAFVTWVAIDHEARTYDDKGRIAEIAYGSGETRLAVKSWWKLLAKENEQWFDPLTKAQSESIAKLADDRAKFVKDTRSVLADIPVDKGRMKELQAAAAELAAKNAALEKKLRGATDAESIVLRTQQKRLAGEIKDNNDELDTFKARLALEDRSIKDQEKLLREFDIIQQKRFFEAFAASHLTRLQQLVQSPLTANANYKERESAATEAQRNAIAILVDRRKAFEIKIDPSAIDRPATKTPTAFELEFDGYLNSERLSQIVFPDALSVQRVVHLTDVGVALPRTWRDVYLYDPKGECVGWARTQTGSKEPAFFTADGLLVAERDELGRCKKAKHVTFPVDMTPGAADRYVLRWAPAAAEAEYEYSGPEDRRGKIKMPPNP